MVFLLHTALVMKIQKILPVFSYLFHPIFISLYGVLLYFFITPYFFNTIQIYLTLLQVAVLTILLPLLFYTLLLSLGLVTSFTEASIEQRKRPILIQMVLFLLLLQFGINKTAMPLLYFFFVGGLCSALFAFAGTLVNQKVSLHMIGISTLTTFIWLLLFYFDVNNIFVFIGSIIACGLVGSSRLYMKSHTMNELFTGTLIGVSSQLLAFLFYITF